MAREVGPEAARNRGLYKIAMLGLAAIVLFVVYTVGIQSNPPGFYLDESGISYNAYLVTQTGAGEFGPKFPLYFQLYTGGYAQFSNPTPVYTLAAVFLAFGPGILIARLTAAAAMFIACLLLGLLAYRMTGKRLTGAIVAVLALLTPWLFEVGRLVMDPLVYVLVIVCFLWSVWLANENDKWTWGNILAIAATLALLTYSYTIGRLLAPLLALGLVLFAVDRRTLVAVLKTWLVYAITLIPLAVYAYRTPELMTRFRLLSYIKPETPYSEVIGKFVTRYIQDINPYTLLLLGDTNPRHHIQDALGSFFIVVFVLAAAGIVTVIARHRNDPWWRYVLFGTAVSIVPGALTIDEFHTLRLIAYPVFLLVLTIPALEWLSSSNLRDNDVFSASPVAKKAIAILLIGVLILEAGYFHYKHYTKGPDRGYVFDTAYKQLYDTAVAQPQRPIFLVDAYWGPAYIHSKWYASLEGRSKGEFVHQPYGIRPPPGTIVLSSEESCTDCQLIRKEGTFLLYRTVK